MHLGSWRWEGKWGRNKCAGVGGEVDERKKVESIEVKRGKGEEDLFAGKKS